MRSREGKNEREGREIEQKKRTATYFPAPDSRTNCDEERERDNRPPFSPESYQAVKKDTSEDRGEKRRIVKYLLLAILIESRSGASINGKILIYSLTGWILSEYCADIGEKARIVFWRWFEGLSGELRCINVAKERGWGPEIIFYYLDPVSLVIEAEEKLNLCTQWSPFEKVRVDEQIQSKWERTRSLFEHF